MANAAAPGTDSMSQAAPSPSAFRWLALITCLTTYALVVVGGVVRATDSGDACPDWPRCHGELLPPLEAHVLIEFSHRLLASVVGLLVLAMVVGAWRSRLVVPVVRWGAAAAVGLVVAQVVLGGATVLSELSAPVVMAHLALAATLLATVLVIAIVSWRGAETALPVGSASFRSLAVFVALATLALMLTGSYVSGSGAGLAFRDWPLFNGQLWPEGGRLAMIHAAHRLAALLVGALLVYVAVRAWRTNERPLMMASALAVVLYAAQALVGAASIWTLLQPATRAAHLALAAGLWAMLVALATWAQLAVRSVVARERVSTRPAEPQREVAVASGTLPARGSS